MPEHLWGMTLLPTQVDDSLASAVAQATAGDEVAFARIVRAHHTDMTRVCFVICGDVDLADEAVGAAWPIVWRKLGSLRDPDRLRPWLVSVAANEARQLLRRQRRRSVVELSVAESLNPTAGDPSGRTDDLDLANAPRPSRSGGPNAPRPALRGRLRLFRTRSRDGTVRLWHTCSPRTPARAASNGARR